jgi:hypothetical protein
MSGILKGTILHVEDDSLWFERVRSAVGDIGELRVDWAVSFPKAVEFLNAKRYDLCILDSRLERGIPRIGQLLKKVTSCSGLSPISVALTAFEGDISERARRALFAVLDKRVVQRHPPLLKQVVLDAFHACNRVQRIVLSQGERGERADRISQSEAEFDVFLAYNEKDRIEVDRVRGELISRKLRPWFDREQIAPGRLFQDEIQEAVPKCRAAAIFIGIGGLGKWEIMELRTFISRCVERNVPVIPVFLPGVKELPEELLFLRELNWVRFVDTIEDGRALDNLEWGVTGVHPRDRERASEGTRGGQAD